MTEEARKTLLYVHHGICFSVLFWQLEYRVTTTWCSLPVLQSPVTLKFDSGVQGKLMKVNDPFFDDPQHYQAKQDCLLMEHEGEKFSILSAKAERNREHMLWYMAVLSYNIC